MVNVSPVQNNSQANLHKEVMAEEISEGTGIIKDMNKPTYDEILKELKESYDNVITKSISKLQDVTNNEVLQLRESLNNEKMKNEKLVKENLKLTKEHESQCALINSQKELIKELKRKLGEQKLKAESTLKTDAEINKLQKENTRLEEFVKNLLVEVSQLKTRNMNIKRHPLTNNEPFTAKENSVTKHSRNLVSKQMNKTVQSIKLKKVSIPKLDLSKLPQKERAQLKIIPCNDPNSIDTSLEST